MHSPMSSDTRDRGTATSVDQTCPSVSRSAIILHSASFRADQSAFCFSESLSYWKSFAWCFLEILWTCVMLSLTIVSLPLNLKNSVGTSFHFRDVAPILLMTLMRTSSSISTALMG